MANRHRSHDQPIINGNSPLGIVTTGLQLLAHDDNPNFDVRDYDPRAVNRVPDTVPPRICTSDRIRRLSITRNSSRSPAGTRTVRPCVLHQIIYGNRELPFGIEQIVSKTSIQWKRDFILTGRESSYTTVLPKANKCLHKIEFSFDGGLETPYRQTVTLHNPSPSPRK